VKKSDLKKKSDKVYPILKILGKRTNARGNTEYKVRWKNYAPEHDSFEPYDNLDSNTQKCVRKNDKEIPNV